MKKKTTKNILKVSLSLCALLGVGGMVVAPLTSCGCSNTPTQKEVTSYLVKCADDETKSIIKDFTITKDNDSNFKGRPTFLDDSQEYQLGYVKKGDTTLSNEEYSYKNYTLTISKTVLDKYSGDITIKFNKSDVVHVESINIQQKEITIMLNENTTLSAVVLPNNATNKNVIWSSMDERIASVSNEGKVYGLMEGTTTIIAKSADNGKYSYCKVEVKDPITHVTKVELNKKTSVLKVGEEESLTATVSPSDATNKNVTWSSSNEPVATVDQNGKVTTHSEGTAIIYVKSQENGKSDSCTITVKNDEIIHVTEVTLDKSSLSIEQGETSKLTATVLPENATVKEVSWSSSDSSIALVSKTGEVKGIKPGTATITVTSTDGSKTAECSVIVNEPTTKIESITLNSTKIAFKQNDTFQLVATILPATATIKDVTWSTSDPSTVSVSETGLITGKKLGKATITCSSKDGSKKAECEVHIDELDVRVKSVTLDRTSISLGRYANDKLVATINPSYATEKEIIWTSSNEEIVSVSEDGVVTAHGEIGEAVITATTLDYNRKATCVVKVEEAEPTLDLLSFTIKKDGTHASVKMKDTYSSIKDNRIVIPETVSINGKTYTVDEIEESGFSGNKYLHAIYLPETITIINRAAFLDCYNLKYINLPEGIKTIYDKTFYNCSSLEDILIPDSVSVIQSEAFYGCSSLNYNVYDNANYLGSYTNPYKVLVSSVNKSISKCEINDSCTTILDGAFKDCASLINITIPESVESMESEVFYGCSRLETVTLSNNITKINDSAFKNCVNLTAIKLPESVNNVSIFAFTGCKNLDSVYIANKDLSESSELLETFKDCSLKYLYLKSGTTPHSSITSKYTKNTSQTAGYDLYIKNN